MIIYKENRGGKPNNQTQLILQALSAAEASIGLAKQLLGGTSNSGFSQSNSRRPERPQFSNQQKPTSRDLPGIIGKYDGINMVGSDGKSFPVPGNYAGKSKLVFGDTLKMMQNPDGTHLFKQIEKVTRKQLEGKLEKDGDQWVVVSPEGKYKVLNSNVEFLGGKEGDRTVFEVPESDLNAPWAAIDAIPVRDEERKAKRKMEVGTQAKTAPEKPAGGLVGKLLEKVAPKTEEKIEDGKKEKTLRKPAVKKTVEKGTVAKVSKVSPVEEKGKTEKEEDIPPAPKAPEMIDEEELR